MGIDADVVRGQLGDILEHLAAAGVFHQFDPQLRIGGVDRDIDGADVHFDDAGDVLIGHIGEGDIAAEQEAHAAVVIFEVEGFAHAAGQLIDEAENALIGAVVLAIHEVIGKFQPQLVVLLFFDVKGERFAVPFHFDGEGSIDHIKAVIQHIVDEIAVDGAQGGLLLFIIGAAELADLLEVIYAAAKARGYTLEQLEAIRAEKASKRGAFEKKILLKEVIEN